MIPKQTKQAKLPLGIINDEKLYVILKFIKILFMT